MIKSIDEITVYGCETKNIVALMVERRDADNRYGNLSCLQYPKEYDYMEQLTEAIKNAILETFGDSINGHFNNISYRNLEDRLDAIAYDVHNNNVDLNECEINFYTQLDFVSDVVCSGFEEHQQEVFDSLFKYIDIDGRAGYLRSEHLDAEEGYYYNKLVDFVFEVREI